MSKPKVLVTRLLPEKPLDVLREHCAVDLYDKHDPMPRELLMDKVGQGRRGHLPADRRRWTAA